jgi:hypothetical protein
MNKVTMMFLVNAISTVCFAGVPVVNGMLNLSLDQTPSLLIMKGSVEGIRVEKVANLRAPVLTLSLVGESQEKIDSYKSQWTLSHRKENDVEEISISQRGGMASSHCQAASFNGEYIRLKGVCLKELVIQVPANIQFAMQDKSTVQFMTGKLRSVVAHELTNKRTEKFLVEDYKEATSDDDKKEVIEKFIRRELKPANLFIHAQALIEILKSISFDDEKMTVIKAIGANVDIQPGQLEKIVECMSFDDAKDSARRFILMRNQ